MPCFGAVFPYKIFRQQFINPKCYLHILCWIPTDEFNVWQTTQTVKMYSLQHFYSFIKNVLILFIAVVHDTYVLQQAVFCLKCFNSDVNNYVSGLIYSKMTLVILKTAFESLFCLL